MSKAPLPFPVGSQQRDELLKLSRCREPGSRARLEELLLEAGLPPDEFKDAETHELPPEGEVLLGDAVCAYRFTGFVLEIEGAVPAEACQGLVSGAEGSGDWPGSTQIHGNGDVFADDARTSSERPVTSEAFPALEQTLSRLLDEAARFYRCRFREFAYSGNTGWTLVRYEEGQHYSRHCDAARGTQNRCLSALLYLNDAFAGGETAFPEQGLEISAKVGKLVLFPPWFTHPHQANPVESGTKYVAVGWFLA